MQESSPESTAIKPPEHAPVQPVPLAGTGLPEVEKRRVFRIFFFVVFAILLYQILRVLALFSDAIIWSSSLALVFFPINLYFRRRLPRRDALAALASTLTVLLLVLIPVITIGWMAMHQAAQVYPTVQGWVTQLRLEETTSLQSLLPEVLASKLAAIETLLQQSGVLAEFDLEKFLLANINVAGAQLADFGAATARNTLFVLGNLVLVAFGMFFCFRDGTKFIAWVFEVVPMPTDQATAIAARVYSTITAIIRGALVTAAVQSVLAAIGYFIADVPLALFFGIATGVAAMIPVVGAALIWLPIGIFVMNDSFGWGLFVLAWGFFVVSLIDNLLKPILIGRGARLPILLIFFGVIGGINVYGFSGVMIGPILIACLLAFLNIYREHYSTITHKQ